ncbi:MAG TPA: protease modulator HflK [Candidatus Baltobacteraceae bacterium]|jgi:membrane protease subunit HflK|nr:protease modulator HflK [Candidatus Baltobacteraceae bacterium]
MSAQEPNLPLTPPPPPPPPAAPPPPPPPEDAGSQALAEALRSSFFIVKIIMVVLVLLFLGSGFFKVDPQYKAIVLRLGKPVGEGEKALLGPGLHWAFPRPIDQVEFIPFTSLQMADSSVGWYQSPDDRARGVPPNPGGRALNPATTTYALTADSNIIHVVATARYRITDPISFHFDFAAGPQFITNDLNNALLYTCSQMPIDDILTSNRTGFRERVQDRVRDLIDSQHLGVTVDQVDIDASPPLYLAPKFNELDQAMQKQGRVRNQAQSYANTTLAGAEGEAATRDYAADAIRKRTVDMVAAQADTFQKLRGQFEQNPAFFERIRQMTLLETIYTNVQDKITMPPNSRELRIELSREPEPPSTNSYITTP